MKKKSSFILILMLAIILAFSGIYFGNAYKRTHDIVSMPCLGCVGMKPIGETTQGFTSSDNIRHPTFVINQLRESVVFLHYRTDVCPACDEMEPVIEELEDVYKDVKFIHINLDHATNEEISSYYIYDVRGTPEKPTGVPMFVILTKKDDKIYYITIYGIISKEKLSTYMNDALNMYGVKKRKVFAELFTDTQCINCPKSEHALKKTNIIFISLISDAPLNISHLIQSREKSYNIPGHPTVVFDGGVEKVIGAKSEDSALTKYEEIKNSLEKKRNKIEFQANWTANKNFINGVINVSVSESVSAHVDAYLIERNSRYRDINGEPIPNGVLARILSYDINIAHEKSINVSWKDDENVLMHLDNKNAFVIVVFVIDGVVDAADEFPLNIIGNISITMQENVSISSNGTNISIIIRNLMKYEKDLSIDWDSPEYLSICGTNKTRIGAFKEVKMNFILSPRDNAPLMTRFEVKFKFKFGEDILIRVMNCIIKGDLEAPKVFSISYMPEEPHAVDVIRIQCKIDDASHIKEVMIVYFVCTKEICEMNVSEEMMKEGDTWYVTVGPFKSKYESLHYKIIAVDEWNNTKETKEYEILFKKEDKTPFSSMIWILLFILIKRKLSGYFVNRRFVVWTDSKTCDCSRGNFRQTRI